MKDLLKKISDTCVRIREGCKIGQENYGPYRHVVAPNTKEPFKNPTNTEVFTYIKDIYKLDKFLDNSETNLKFFGYGFSGSGKTYTLLQGSR